MDLDKNNRESSDNAKMDSVTTPETKPEEPSNESVVVQKTEITVTPEVKKAKKQKKEGKTKTKVWDNLLSTLLLILLLGLISVVYYLINENVSAGNLDTLLANYLIYGLYILMGLGIFFATRTGEGKNVFRVNWFSICFILLPLAVFYTCYALLENAVIEDTGFIYDTVIWVLETGGNIFFTLGLVLFGYTLPYSFISGFERRYKEEIPEVKAVEAEAEPGSSTVTTTTTLETAPEETASSKTIDTDDLSETVQP